MEKQTVREEEKTPEQIYQVHSRKGGAEKVKNSKREKQGEGENQENKTKGPGGEEFTRKASFDVG